MSMCAYIQKLHHFYNEHVREVSLPACASIFETSVQAYMKDQINSSTLAGKLCSRTVAVSMLAVKLCSHSVALSTLAVKVQLISQRSLESTCDRTRSFAATIIEASTHMIGSKIEYAHSFLLLL